MIAFISAVQTDVVAARAALGLLPDGFPDVTVLTAGELPDKLSIRKSLQNIKVVVIRILGGRS